MAGMKNKKCVFCNAGIMIWSNYDKKWNCMGCGKSATEIETLKAGIAKNIDRLRD
jgi:hypothetical protein